MEILAAGQPQLQLGNRMSAGLKISLEFSNSRGEKNILRENKLIGDYKTTLLH